LAATHAVFAPHTHSTPPQRVMNAKGTSLANGGQSDLGRDQLREPYSVPRAILVERHARDRGNCRRLIDPAARVANLTRHASAAVARVRTLAVTAPRAIGMVLADPAGVVANRARHDCKIGVATEKSESGWCHSNFGARTKGPISTATISRKRSC
jgi:hypothetical protein